jgi:2-polyprenyl-3-methyl-5-hydroxy-6-metoxy-1,4-benzoquinol methylase
MKSFSSEQVAKANKEFYNAVYNSYLQDEAYAYTDDIVTDVRRLLSLGASQSDSRDCFFDVACGSGFLSSHVIDMQLFASCHGVDISENQIKLYNERLHVKGGEGVVGDLATMDFGTKRFGMVAGYSVLHHFYDYSQILRRCWDILTPGGCMYFDFEPNANFKKTFNSLIRVRRMLSKHSQRLDSLEEIAEYHNNYSLGIAKDGLFDLFEGNFEIIEEGARFPGTTTGTILRLASKINPVFSPLFYFLIKKKK